MIQYIEQLMETINFDPLEVDQLIQNMALNDSGVLLYEEQVGGTSIDGKEWYTE